MSVKKIAIIGGGPSGLVALNEFLHTAQDGSSTINSTDPKNVHLPKNCAFDEIVVFDQGKDIGGVWNYNAQTDPYFPDSKNYSLPEFIRPNIIPPDEKLLENSSFKYPIETTKSNENIQLWNNGGVYDNLFTNIPNRLMHFSSCFDYNVPGTDPNSNIYYPFVKHEQVLEYIRHFADVYDLKKHIRFNTMVEKVHKIGEKWHVTVVQTDNNFNTEKWYTEIFDAVVVSVGRFNVPFFPHIEGMHEFVLNHPGVIQHTKCFRNTDDLKDKKLLLVGTSISSVDLLQYFLPKCKEVWLSSNSNTSLIDDNSEPKSWIEEIMKNKDLNFLRVPRIKKFVNNSVEFEDGTITSDFDRIVFATGYHLSFPFLDIPENKGKEYIQLASGRDDQENYSKTKVDNLFLYTFSIGDPTLCHLGIQNTPLFFLAAEVNSIAIAGIWSGTKKLPPKEEQIEWCKNRFEGKIKSFQFISENEIPDYFRMFYRYAPDKRLDIVRLLQDDEIKNSKSTLSKLFYKYVNKELSE